MPDMSGATVLDDLPESIITQEIFPRLPSKDVVRCGAVSKSWRDATSDEEFLIGDHRRQPLLPLLSFYGGCAIDVLDIREAPAKRRPLLARKNCDPGSTLEIQASCDGLLLLSRPNVNGPFSIVNPTTRQWLELPRLTKIVGTPRLIGAGRKIAGMYPDPHRSGEYRILFRRGETTDRNASFYILTVGASKNQQKPKCIGPSVASGVSMWHPPVLLNGCLHWVPDCDLEDGLLVFDTAEESFRWMSLPVRGSVTLLETEGALSMWSVSKRVIKVWVLQDYEKVIWSLKCEIGFPVVKCWYTLLSHERDMLIYSVDSCLHQLHYDENGKILQEFQWGKNIYLDITEYWFKESLIRHTFFPFQGEEMTM